MTVWALNCSPSPRSAATERANTTRPLVSLSSRWTTRRRGRGPLRRLPSRAAISGGTRSSSVGWSALRRVGQSRSTGWRTVEMPAGFSTTTRCSSRWRKFNGCRGGLANLHDDLVKRHGFAAHGHALGVVVQDHLGPLQAALRLDLALRASSATPKPEKGHGDDDHSNPSPWP